MSTAISSASCETPGGSVAVAAVAVSAAAAAAAAAAVPTATVTSVPTPAAASAPSRGSVLLRAVSDAIVCTLG